MGFWSTVGKIAPIAAMAIPGIGPAIGLGAKGIAGLSAGLGALGKVAGGASAGRAAGREREAGINISQDQLRLLAARMLEDSLQGRRGLEIDERNYALKAPGMRAGASVRGDVLANAQDAQIRGPITRTRGQIPQISGGLRPSLMSGNTRQLGSEMSRNALMSQMKGDAFEPLSAPQMPDITPSPQAGGFDKFLNIAGGVGTAVGALDESGLLDRYKNQWMKPGTPSAVVPPIPQIPGRKPWPDPLEEAMY